MIKPKVSVTVPIYNTAKYLSKCLDSLLNQTLKDIEFILVNDGSTDGSGEICDEYASKDSRFRVIHKANGGLASARQAGLDAANGEYVIVCDSDDWVHPEIYERLYYAAISKSADISVCGFYSEYSDGKSIRCQTIFEEKNGVVDNVDFIRRGANTSWIKLIKKSLFDRAEAYYEPGINLSEDALIIYKLLKTNPIIVQIQENLYHYRRLYGESTYTNSLRMNTIRQKEFTYRWFCTHYAGFEDVKYYLAINIAFSCMRASDLDNSYLRDFLKNELPWSKITFKQLPLKSMMIIIEKILPIPLSQKIFNIVYPLFYR